ncbi:hypothetical protein [Paracoccus aestuariivivens]|nr:hypothetical protein [Paracoccus aestuariivivens]
MKRIFALLAVLVTLVALAAPQAQARATGKPIVIANDRGGNVVRTMQRRQELEASGRPVEIRGYCRSACTMYITMRNACLGPGATVGFHAPRIPNTHIIPPLVDQLMARYYRNGILQKWNSEWKHSLKMHKISAKQYVRLDPQTRLCSR